MVLELERFSKESDGSYRSPQTSPTNMEIEQLRQESEMFAGQVIELDEEIENLRLALEERDANVEKLQQEIENLRSVKPGDSDLEKVKDDKIAALMNELNDLKSRPVADGNEVDKIRTLEAEVDELRESNADQMSELRTLRRVARDANSSADEIAKANARTAEAMSKIDELRKVIDGMSKESESLKKELEESSSNPGDSAAEEAMKSLANRWALAM